MEKVIGIAELYKKLKFIEASMVTKAELNQAMETVLVMSNPDTMRQIEASEIDIKEGKVKRIYSLSDLD